MKRLAFTALLLGAVVLVAGCASGPRYRDSGASLPPLPADMGRIYVYRTTAFGAAVQPKVMLNGEEIGTSVPHGIFYVDRAPGDYEVATSTEVKRKLTFTLAKGEVKYVRLAMQMGFFVGHVIPQLVEPKEAEAEIGKLHLVAAKS